MNTDPHKGLETDLIFFETRKLQFNYYIWFYDMRYTDTKLGNCIFLGTASLVNYIRKFSYNLIK